MREEAIKILARYCVERYLEKHRTPVGGAMYVDLHRGLDPEERTVCPLVNLPRSVRDEDQRLSILARCTESWVSPLVRGPQGISLEYHGTGIQPDQRSEVQPEQPQDWIGEV